MHQCCCKLYLSGRSPLPPPSNSGRFHICSFTTFASPWALQFWPNIIWVTTSFGFPTLGFQRITRSQERYCPKKVGKAVTKLNYGKRKRLIMEKKGGKNHVTSSENLTFKRQSSQTTQSWLVSASAKGLGFSFAAIRTSQICIIPSDDADATRYGSPELAIIPNECNNSFHTGTMRTFNAKCGLSAFCVPCRNITVHTARRRSPPHGTTYSVMKISDKHTRTSHKVS